MAKISSLIIALSLYLLVLVNTSQQQQLGNTTATCNFTACNSQRTPCSSNLDCECFSLTSNASTGICGSTVFSCTGVVRCNMDNKTCPIDNTVCVNSTRCGQPVCYPLALSNKLVCPRNGTGTTSTTVKVTNTTTARTSTTTHAGSTTNTTKSSSPMTATTMRASSNGTISSTTSPSTGHLNTTTSRTNTNGTCANGNTLITFDNLTDWTQIPNGYNNINWANGSSATGYSSSGYDTAAVSGNGTLYNAYGFPMTMTSANGSLFNLYSAAAAAAWNDNLQLTVVGYRSNVVIATSTFTLQVFTVSYLTFTGYSRLDTAIFSTSNGTHNPNVTGSGTQFAMDNLCLSFT